MSEIQASPDFKHLACLQFPYILIYCERLESKQSSETFNKFLNYRQFFNYNVLVFGRYQTLPLSHFQI